MGYYVLPIISGLVMTGVGVLMFFRPQLLRPLVRLMSWKERRKPADEAEQTFNKMIGAGIALLGLAYTIRLIVECLAK